MKTEHTAAELEEIAAEISEIILMLREVTETMQEAGIPTAEVHTQDVLHKHIPALWKWAIKLKSEFQVQLRVFQAARKDRAETGKPAARKRPGKRN